MQEKIPALEKAEGRYLENGMLLIQGESMAKYMSQPMAGNRRLAGG